RVGVEVHAGGEVSVQDAGPGIPADLLPTVFEPFAKFPPNRNGHGLGLAIVKAVAELHGGSVRAGHAPAGGACFTLAFPPVQLQD
ncbi:sensor histidine kinase, partial [Xanthomonas theicola]